MLPLAPGIKIAVIGPIGIAHDLFSSYVGDAVCAAPFPSPARTLGVGPRSLMPCFGSVSDHL
jgi:hypothetical protein